MNPTPCLALAGLFILTSCDKGTSAGGGGAKAPGGGGSGGDAAFVSAVIDGQPWRSDDILVTHAETGDRFTIHTTDNAKKKDIVLDLAPFSKTKAGSYNSAKADRTGISLLDTDKDDGVEFDFDNYLEHETPNCIQVTSIKDLDGKKQLIEGAFQSEMVPSFNAAGKKTLQIKDGKFKVIYDPVANDRP
jgi:hypothetical protein